MLIVSIFFFKFNFFSNLIFLQNKIFFFFFLKYKYFPFLYRIFCLMNFSVFLYFFFFIFRERGGRRNGEREDGEKKVYFLFFPFEVSLDTIWTSIKLSLRYHEHSQRLFIYLVSRCLRWHYLYFFQVLL